MKNSSRNRSKEHFPLRTVYFFSSFFLGGGGGGGRGTCS